MAPPTRDAGEDALRITIYADCTVPVNGIYLQQAALVMILMFAI